MQPKKQQNLKLELPRLPNRRPSLLPRLRWTLPRGRGKVANLKMIWQRCSRETLEEQEEEQEA